MDQRSSPSDEEAFAFATHVLAGTVLPAALRSAIELDLLELIKRAGSVSPKELAAQIRATNPEADVTLDRILRLLAANDILDCRLRTLPHGGVERLYSLTPLSKFLTKNEEGVSMAPMLLMALHKAPMQSWYHLKDAVVEGIVPFEKANGTMIFDCSDKNPGFSKIFNQAMHDFTVIFMGRILETYHGFEGLKTLVDVGGGIGASLRMILSKYLSIKAINFDLPHVIKDAPPISGVEHVSGDMFISVPTADAIFMKWICHDWSDDECVKLLKNCEVALPHYGKLIIADCLLSEIPKKDIFATNDFAYDLVMLAQTPSGKERTEREFHALAKASGFKQFRVVSSCFGISIMELYK